MEGTELIGRLEEAVPGGVFEIAPSIDLQTTVYVPAERVPRSAGRSATGPSCASTSSPS